MSRRTKLLITALFLVLLAVPAIYLAYTWSVQDPLRFRITREEKVREQDGLLQIRLHMEVTNISATSVYLSEAVLTRLDVPALPKGWRGVASPRASHGLARSRVGSPSRRNLDDGGHLPFSVDSGESIQTRPY